MTTASSHALQQHRNSSACSFTMDKQDFSDFFENPPIFDVPPMKFGDPLNSRDAWSKIAHDILSPFNEYQYYIKQQEKFRENQRKFQNLSFLLKKRKSKEKTLSSSLKKKFTKLRTCSGARLSFLSNKTHKFNSRANKPSAISFRDSFLQNQAKPSPKSSFFGLSPASVQRRTSMMSFTTKLESIKSPQSRKTIEHDSPPQSHSILQVPSKEDLSRNISLKKSKTQPKATFIHQINSLLKEIKPKKQGLSRPRSPDVNDNKVKQSRIITEEMQKKSKHFSKTQAFSPFLQKVHEGQIFKNQIKNAPIDRQITINRKIQSKRASPVEMKSPAQARIEYLKTPPSKNRSILFKSRVGSGSNKKQRQSDFLEQELNRRYTPITLSKLSIRETYEPSSTINTPSNFKEKEFRIRAIRSAGKLSKPKINRYVLKNLIKCKDPEVFPEKYQLEKGKPNKKEHRSKQQSLKRIAQNHFAKLKSFLDRDEFQNDELIFIQHTPSQHSIEGTTYELTRNNSTGVVPQNPILFLNPSEATFNCPETATPKAKRVWLSKFSKNTRRILTDEISKCLVRKGRRESDSPLRMK